MINVTFLISNSNYDFMDTCKLNKCLIYVVYRLSQNKPSRLVVYNVNQINAVSSVIMKI